MCTDWFKFYAVSPHMFQMRAVTYPSVLCFLPCSRYKGLLFSLCSLSTFQADDRDSCQLNKVWINTTFHVPSYKSYLAISIYFLSPPNQQCKQKCEDKINFQIKCKCPARMNFLAGVGSASPPTPANSTWSVLSPKVVHCFPQAKGIWHRSEKHDSQKAENHFNTCSPHQTDPGI